ncbi:hypothetical protein TNCV_198291 [Trichonephila clavipes]|nr:hypothetical protein TNCV_198291 [Trichonephila clavipes]
MHDSSVKTTSFYSATHILLSSHHWRRSRLWFRIKGRPSNGRLTDRPLYCKRRRMGVAFTVASSVNRLRCPIDTDRRFSVKYVETQTSSRWCGVEVWRGGETSGVILVTSPLLKITRSITNSSRSVL